MLGASRLVALAHRRKGQQRQDRHSATVQSHDGQAVNEQGTNSSLQLMPITLRCQWRLKQMGHLTLSPIPSLPEGLLGS